MLCLTINQEQVLHICLEPLKDQYNFTLIALLIVYICICLMTDKHLNLEVVHVLFIQSNDGLSKVKYDWTKGTVMTVFHYGRPEEKHEIPAF